MPATISENKIFHEHLTRTTEDIDDSQSARNIALFVSSHATPDDYDAVQDYVEAVARIVRLPRFEKMMHGLMTQKHCVRCHADYSEYGVRDRGRPCVVPHMFSCETYHFSGSYLKFPAICCGGEVVEEDYYGAVSKAETMCFEGMHTTDQKEVEHLYNHYTIVPCDLDASGKCIRKLLDADPDEGPIFES